MKRNKLMARKSIRRDPRGRELSTNEEEEDAILRDGESFHLPLYMRDGSINPRLSASQRAIAESRGPMIVDSLGGTVGLNRHGYRYASAPPTSADHAKLVTQRALIDEAYKTYDLDESRRYQGDASDAANTAPPSNTRSDSTTDAREREYQLYDEDAANAWRRK
jgi:hypothetical protein